MKLPKIPTTAVALIVLLHAGCSDEPSVQKYRVSKTPLPASSNAGTSPGSGGVVDQGLPFTWVVPEGWEAGKDSSMRLASYNVPLSTGETGDFSLVQLSGAAGGVMANINRWRGQIGLDPVEVEGLGSSAHMHDTGHGHQYLHVTLINEDNPENAILGAIFQQPDYVLFAKLTASRAGAEEAQDSFEAFCNSISFK